MKKISSKSLLNPLVIILIIAAFIIGFTLGNYKKIAKSSSISADDSDSNSYTHEQLKDYVNTFKGFTIYYPSSWELTINEGFDNVDPVESQMLFLNLKKGKSRMEIKQAAMGPGGCLFPDNEDQEGPFARFEEYVVLRTTEGNEWRRAKSLIQQENQGQVYVVCTGTTEDLFFNSGTQIGPIIYYIHPDDSELVSELDEIVKKIEIKE